MSINRSSKHTARALNLIIRGRHTVQYHSRRDGIIFVLRTQLTYGVASGNVALKRQCNSLVLTLCKALKSRDLANQRFLEKLCNVIEDVLQYEKAIPNVLNHVFLRMRNITKPHRTRVYNRFDEEYLCSDLTPLSYLSEDSASDTDY